MDAMTRPLSKLNPYILGKSVATNHSSPNSSTFRTSNLSKIGPRPATPQHATKIKQDASNLSEGEGLIPAVLQSKANL